MTGSCVIRETTHTGCPWSRPRVSLSIYLSIYLRTCAKSGTLADGSTSRRRLHHRRCAAVAHRHPAAPVLVNPSELDMPGSAVRFMHTHHRERPALVVDKTCGGGVPDICGSEVLRKAFMDDGARFVDDVTRMDGFRPKKPWAVCQCQNGCTANATAEVIAAWSPARVGAAIAIAKARLSSGRAPGLPDPRAYPHAAADHFEAFSRFPVRGKRCLVGGSERPWIEILLASMGAAEVLTSEYRLSDFRAHSGVSRLVSVQQLSSEHAFAAAFDCVVSFSSIEHDGLGRYCDPLDPAGDEHAVHEFRKVLKPGGLLFLGIPAIIQGNNATVIYGNSGRMYNRQRFLRITRGFEWVDTIQTHYTAFGGPDSINKDGGPPGRAWTSWAHGIHRDWMSQPIFVLRKQS